MTNHPDSSTQKNWNIFPRFKRVKYPSTQTPNKHEPTTNHFSHPPPPSPRFPTLLQSSSRIRDISIILPGIDLLSVRRTNPGPLPGSHLYRR